MTRYSRLRIMEDKRSARKAVGLLFLAGIVVGLAVFAGLKVLTQFFLLINGWSSRGSTVSKDDFIPPSPPQLYLPSEATNSATITLSGSAEAGATVFVTLNSDPLKSIVAADDGSFVISDIKLGDGNNSFSGVAVDVAGNKSQVADSEVVYYSNKEPKLEVTNPSNNQNFAGKDNFVEVKGTTDPENRLTVNDRQVILSNSGGFVYRLGLMAGENKFIIAAADQAGNRKQVELMVNYSQ